MKILVLGASPAGLMAAHAAALNQHDVIIASKKGRKSKMMGAQYLHAPIPFASQSEAFLINYKLVGGDAEDYRSKVYGDGWDGKVSPEDMTATHKGWDIREAYNWLWDTYSPFIQDWDAVRPSKVDEVIAWALPEITISTIPAPLLCDKGHTFASAKIFSSDKRITDISDNTVICNAAESPLWYRSARINDWDTVEWPGYGAKPPITPIWEVTKPTFHNCTCRRGIKRMGRYGSWKKGVLSHEAFFNTSKIVVPSQEVLF